MTKPEVAILMSTYNGEKYLADQINSIIRQSCNTWHLYIRDDGSKDKTIDLIKKFADKNERITFVNENNPENLGVTGSFMRLLSETEADYYMFSDQDDYWKSNKVAATLAKMKNAEEQQQQPICVHTNLTIVDANLNGDLLMNKPEDRWSGFKNLLFKNCVTGCTLMINQSLKDLIDFNDSCVNKVYLHDWWIALIAASFGRVVYLDQSTILYRQHEGNLVGSDRKGTAWYHNTVNDPLNERVTQMVRMARDFWQVYGKRLTGSNKIYTKLYASLASRSNPFWNLYVVCKCPPVRPTLRGDVLFSFLIIKDFKILRKLG